MSKIKSTQGNAPLSVDNVLFWIIQRLREKITSYNYLLRSSECEQTILDGTICLRRYVIYSVKTDAERDATTFMTAVKWLYNPEHKT